MLDVRWRCRQLTPQTLPLLLAGVLLDNPQRVGKPLSRELAGYHSARRGAYRVVYRIDEATRVVHVVRIDHRADVYATHGKAGGVGCGAGSAGA